MRLVPVSQSPNQSFTVTIDAVRWVIRLIDANGVAAVSISREGVDLIDGSRVLVGEPLIPYAYLQNGNFIFIVDGDTLPNYSQFGITQFLVYLSNDEIRALPQLTVADLAPFVPSYLITDDGFYITTDAGEILTDD